MVIRVLGKNLNDKQVVPFALAAAIYGIGIKRAKIICKEAEIDLSSRVRDLSDLDALKIQNVIKDLGYLVSSDLQREERNWMRRLSAIRCYRWLCREAGRPARGQRTRSNANTAFKARRSA